jgi:hypothetical protein
VGSATAISCGFQGVVSPWPVAYNVPQAGRRGTSPSYGRRSPDRQVLASGNSGPCPLWP